MTLVSGSTDGLIAVHDLQSGFDDEEAFQASGVCLVNIRPPLGCM